MENGQLLTSIAELIQNNTTIVNKQDKTDNTLTTTDKTVSGAINEINSKEITNETNISSHISNGNNPHNTNLSQLKDIIITSPTDKQQLGYDLASNKFINQDNVDEKVKISAISNSKYLGEWIDGITIQNVGGKLVAKSLDALDTTLREMNFLSGLDENIMTKFSSITNGNGGIEVYKNGTFATYSDLLAFNFTTLTVGKTYLMYIISDEGHLNNGTTYMSDSTTNNTSNLPKYCGLSSATQRILSIDKVDLANETKGILEQSHINMTDIVKTTDLANYETISDLQANYVTKNEVSNKANSSDVYTTVQTDNLLANKLDKTNIKAGTNITFTTDLNNNVIINSTGGTGGTGTGGHIIKDSTTTFIQRKNLKIIGDGVTVTDDSINDTTLIDIIGGIGSGFLNVKGLGMTISDGGTEAIISFTNPASDNIDKVYLYISYLEDLSNQNYEYVSTHATMLSNILPITNGITNTFNLPITDVNRNKSSYIKVFVGYGGTDYSSGSSINQVLSDTTPTSPTTNISITQLTKASVKLNWINPTETDLKNVNVLMKYDTTINDIYDGTIVYTGSSNTCTITGLEIGKHVYFRFYTLDKSDNINSDISQIIDIQLDNTPPNEVTGFSALSGFSVCKLKFSDSTSIDWKMTKVIRKVGSESTSIDDGTLVLTNMAKDSYKNNYFIDGGLSNGVSYYYKIYSIDNFDNISSGVTQIGNPIATALPEVNNFKIENLENGTKQKISWTNSFAPSGLTYVERQLFYTKDQTVALDTMTRDQCIASGLITSLTLGTGTGQGLDDSFTTSTTLTKGDISRYKVYIHYDSSGTPVWNSGTYDIKEVKDETPLINVTGLITNAGDTQNIISWINPDTALDSDFAKVQIFRKIGSYPDGNNDLEKVFESASQNVGNLNTFVDTGLINSTIYYYLIKLLDASGNINVNTKFTLQPIALPIYGIQYDSSNRTWTRLGLASSMTSTDFNAISPYKDIKRVLLTDAKAKTYLKSTDSTLKEDGTSATLDGTVGNIFSEFPKLFYKYENSGTIHKWYIANSAIGGCTPHKSFIRNSVTKDYLYMGCYKGYVNGTKLESRSGILPTTSGKSFSDFRTLAEARGTGFTQFDSLSLHLLQVLFLVQYATADFSTILNSGQNIGTISTTGGTNSLGNTTGVIGNYSSLYGIETLIGETHSVIDGIIAGSKYWQSNNSFASMTSESVTGTYTQLSTAIPSNINGFISDIEPLESVIIGKTMDGSSSDGFYDYQVSKNGSNLNVMLLGGSSLASQRGLFNNEFVDVTNMSTTTNMTSEGSIDSIYNVWSYTLDRSNFGIKSLSSYSLIDNTTPQITANLQIQNLSGRLICY